LYSKSLLSFTCVMQKNYRPYGALHKTYFI
jgi:hypothetical protein